MRYLFVLSLALVPVLGDAGHVGAGDRETALATIDQAIKAHGGEAALTRTRTLNRTSTGSLNLFGKGLPFMEEMVSQLPTRFRSDMTIDENGQKTRILIVVNGDRGWQSAGGAVTDITKPRLAEMQEEAQIQWYATLLPLKTDSSLELAPAADVKVNDQPALGVKVSRKGHADVRLYFDKKTALLVKIERKAQEAGLMIDKEYLYSDLKSFDGVLLPAKTVELINGKKFVEVGSASYRLSPRVGESVFAKP